MPTAARQYPVPDIGELHPGRPRPDEDDAARFIRAIHHELETSGIAISHAYYNRRPLGRRFAQGGIVAYGVERERRVAHFAWHHGHPRMSWGMDIYSSPTVVRGNDELEAAELALPGNNGPAYTLLHTHGVIGAYAQRIASAAATDYVHLNLYTCAQCGQIKPQVRDRDKACSACLRHTPQARAERERQRQAHIKTTRAARTAARTAPAKTPPSEQLTLFDTLPA